MYCRICEIKIEEGNVCERCIHQVIGLKNRLIADYSPEECSKTEEWSEGNATDVFQDGLAVGEHISYYSIGLALGINLPEPHQQKYSWD